MVRSIKLFASLIMLRENKEPEKFLEISFLCCSRALIFTVSEYIKEQVLSNIRVFLLPESVILILIYSLIFTLGEQAPELTL